MISRHGLFRDPSQGWIAGVAAGLGERFGLNAAIIRLAFVVVALAGTPVLAVVVYAVLAVLLPVKPLIIEDYSFRRRWRREY